MKPTALLWDLDGTLVDSEPVHEAALDAALAQVGLAVGAEFHPRTLGVNEADVHALLVAETGLTLDLEAWRALKWEFYGRFGTDIRRRPGVGEAAVDWATRGTPSAIVSNSTREEVALALAATGIGQAIETFVSFSDVTRGKPDPEGYLLAAERLDVDPAACLVIEDSPVGVSAALAAGMRVIFHPQKPTPAPSGAHYLPPDGNFEALLTRTMTTGQLP